MASTGAFISGDTEIIGYLKYNMRSQMFAKSLQMQLVKGALKRLDMLRNQPEFKHPKLTIDNYWNDLKNYKYDHLVLTTSAKPFEDDYSDILMKKIIQYLMIL